MSPIAFVMIGIAVLALFVGIKGTYKELWTNLTGSLLPANSPTIGITPNGASGDFGGVSSASGDFGVSGSSGNFGTPTTTSGNQPTPGAAHLKPGVDYSLSALQKEANIDANSNGINSAYFLKQIGAESNWNVNAISPSGAIGIAQFMPATAAGLGIDPWEPDAALQGAAQLMRKYISQYGGEDQALAAYNAGPGGLLSAQANAASHNASGSWIHYLPLETQNYIKKITGD